MKKVSIIIPAYNEEETLPKIVDLVKKANICSLEKEIIVVDNNSNDNTLKIAESIPNIKVFSEKTRGKGAAVKRGFREATGDILTIQDADLEYNPNDLATIVKPILDGNTEVTNGIRMENRFREDNYLSLGIVAWFGNKLITWTTNVLYLNNASEYEGCYKAFTKKLTDSIFVKTNDFDFDNELICKILKRGYKPIDIPIHYSPRNYSQGKKINWRHGFKILWTIIKIRFID